MSSNYLTKFIKAYESSLKTVSFGDIKSREYFEACWENRAEASMIKEIETYTEEAKSYFEEFKSKKDISSLVNRCHEVSQNFAECIYKIDEKNNKVRKPIFITIGNVKLDGEYLYDIDINKLKERFEAGIKSHLPIDFHVWITLPDLSIIDLTLHATMTNEDGNENIQLCEIIIDKNGSDSPLEYEPLFVHNDIMSLIF